MNQLSPLNLMYIIRENTWDQKRIPKLINNPYSNQIIVKNDFKESSRQRLSLNGHEKAADPREVFEQKDN